MKIITKKAVDVVLGDYLVPFSGVKYASHITFIEKGETTVRLWGGRSDPLTGPEDFWVAEFQNDQEVEVADLSDFTPKKQEIRA